MRRLPCGLLLAVALLAAPARADDDKDSERSSSGGSPFRRQGALLDRSAQKRPHMLSAFLGIPYGVGFYNGRYISGFPFGIGGRYMLPIVHDGFIPPVNDSFGLELGLDFAAFSVGTGFYPALSIPIEAYWMFHFTQNFAMYAKVGVSVDIGFVQFCDSRGCYGSFGARPISALGLTYKANDWLFLRLEAGYPWFKLGLGFAL